MVLGLTNFAKLLGLLGIVASSTSMSASGGDGLCTEIIVDVGSSKSKVFAYDCLMAGKKKFNRKKIGGSIKGGLHTACGADLDSESCTKHIDELKARFISAKKEYPGLKSIRMIATGGMRAMDHSEEIWAKVEEMIAELELPQSVEVEAKTMSKYEEAKTEFIAVMGELEQEKAEQDSTLENGMWGMFAIGGTSFQFGLATSDEKVLFDSYRIGVDLAFDKVKASPKASTHCALGSAAGACRSEIETLFKKDVYERLQRADNAPASEQWAQVRLVAIGILFWYYDYMRFLGLLPKTAESACTLKEFKRAGEKLCGLTQKQAQRKINGKQHVSSAAEFIDTTCFRVSYFPYVFEALNVPEESKIRFFRVKGDWTLGYLMEVSNILPDTLKGYDMNTETDDDAPALLAGFGGDFTGPESGPSGAPAALRLSALLYAVLM